MDEKLRENKIRAQLKPEYYAKYDDTGLPFEIPLSDIDTEDEYNKFIEENYIIEMFSVYYKRDGFKLPEWKDIIADLLEECAEELSDANEE